MTTSERLTALHQAFIDMADRLVKSMKEVSTSDDELEQMKKSLQDLMEEIKRIEAKRLKELEN